MNASRTEGCRRAGGVIACLLAVAAPAAAQQPTATQRLARELAQAAATVAGAEPLTVPAVEGALSLIRQAALLDPQNPEIWRQVLQVADLAENDELRADALSRLVRLDPQDEVIRLRYVRLAVDRRQTLEERVEAFRTLLSDGYRERLGPAVASRLAFDLADLLYRAGDVDGFARWLAEASARDPANREAASVAAGYYQARVDDPYAQAELLTALLLADPTDTATLSSIAEILLDQGAFAGASRLYGLVVRVLAVRGRAPQGGQLADWAVALWGRGDPQAALDMISQRQRQVDALYRARLARDNPQMSPLEVARMPSAPLLSTLATVRAAILERRGGEEAPGALRGAITAYRTEIEGHKAQKTPDAGEIRRLTLEAAWVALWLGADPAEAETFIEQAAADPAGGPLRDQARARFDGWLALRKGDPEAALALLSPIASDDPAAQLGAALAELALGRVGPGARGLLEVARRQPGTAIGVWAADRLAAIVGRRPEPTPQAARLEALAASIPPMLDRFPDDPTMAVSLRIIPQKTTFEPYEPILVDLEIANNAPVPLAIDRSGPIGPSVLVFVEAHLSGYPRLPEPDPLVIAIDRRLRLGPSERLVVPVDIRRGRVLEMLDTLPLPGATLKVRAMLNYSPGPGGAMRPDVLGSEAHSPPLRIDGVRVSQAWITSAMAAVLEPDSSSDFTTMALLAHVVAGRPPAETAELPPEVRRILGEGAIVIAEGYTRLEPPARAWLLSVVPRGAALEPLLAMARKDSSPFVQIAYLLHCLGGPDDPMLAAARRGDDPAVEAVGLMMERALAAAAQSPPAAATP